MFWEISEMEIYYFENVAKDRARTNLKICLIDFEHLEYGINIYQIRDMDTFENLEYGINTSKKT